LLGRVASHANHDNRSSALFGAPMPLSFVIIYFFYLFSCMAPITGALIARAAPLRSAETVFCFSFQPNVPVTSGGFLPSGGLGGSVKLFGKFFHCLCSCEHSHSCFHSSKPKLFIEAFHSRSCIKNDITVRKLT